MSLLLPASDIAELRMLVAYLQAFKINPHFFYKFFQIRLKTSISFPSPSLLYNMNTVFYAIILNRQPFFVIFFKNFKFFLNLW